MTRLFLLNHPDVEPGYHKRKIGSVNILPWNNGKSHWRKFISREGVYLDRGVQKSSNLCFWGEYEPYSMATIISKTKPRAIHADLKPVRMLPSMPTGALNTDPYVYGCFRNICCRRGNTKYQKDDILVFGTFKSNTIFEFDTVIVVEKLVPCGLVPIGDQYRLASIDPLKQSPIDFIDGAVYNPDSQYFSFVPCLPNCTSSGHFKKPFLDVKQLFGLTAHNGWYGKVIPKIEMNNSKVRQQCWHAILRAVQKEKLFPGVYVNKIDNEKIF